MRTHSDPWVAAERNRKRNKVRSCPMLGNHKIQSGSVPSSRVAFDIDVARAKNVQGEVSSVSGTRRVSGERPKLPRRAVSGHDAAWNSGVEMSPECAWHDVVERRRTMLRDSDSQVRWSR